MNCPYCQQAHTRAQLYRGASGHWADNASPLEWFDAFERRFSAYSCVFHLTGGEPMLDRRMRGLLSALVDSPWVDVAHVDTNGSFRWTLSDASKVLLNLSYHPTQETLEAFLAKLNRLRSSWQILLVNVMAVEGVDLRAVANAVAPAPLACIPEQGQGVTPYVHPQLAEFTPAFDLKRGFELTYGSLCEYPSVAYEVEPDGSLITACHRGKLHGSLFGDAPLPPLFAGRIPCPKQSCTCEERYGFLTDVALSPKVDYAARLSALQRGSNRVQQSDAAKSHR